LELIEVPRLVFSEGLAAEERAWEAEEEEL
jgi:hypothetical protein